MIHNDTKVELGGRRHLDTFAYIIFIYLYILTMLPMTLLCIYYPITKSVVLLNNYIWSQTTENKSFPPTKKDL